MKFPLWVPVLMMALLSLYALTARAGNMPQPGQPAPNFSLGDQNGTVQNLADYRGKWLVLYFYPKDETPGCTTEACAFRDDIQKIKALDAAVIGVSIDDASNHAEFAKKHHLPFPLLADKSGAVSESYGSERNLLGFKIARRNTFIIAPDGKIAKVYESVDPDSTSDEVINDLKKLSAKP